MKRNLNRSAFEWFTKRFCSIQCVGKGRKKKGWQDAEKEGRVNPNPEMLEEPCGRRWDLLGELDS